MSAADDVPVLQLRVATLMGKVQPRELVIFSLPLDMLLVHQGYRMGANVNLGMAQPGTELVAVLMFAGNELRARFVVPDRSDAT